MTQNITFKYAEYAFGSIKNRNHIHECNTFLPLDNNEECYRSMFFFDENIKTHLESTGSISGYQGEHITDQLIIDFDMLNLDSSLDDVRSEVIKFCKILHDEFNIPSEYLRFWFSGMKGFHIAIRMEVFGAIQPSLYCDVICKEIVNSMTTGIQFIDRGIYQVSRLIRISGSIHQVTGLYKIPLTYDEIENMSIDDIREMAKNRRTIQLDDKSPITAIDSCVKLYSDVVGRLNTRSSSSNSFPKSTDNIFEMLLNGVTMNRNDAAMKISGHLIAHNYNQQDTLMLVQDWNLKNADPLPMNEIQEVVEKAYRNYGSKQRVISIDDIIDYETGCEQYHERSQHLDVRRASIGFPSIDGAIRGGILPGEIMCIQAKTSVGKSAFLQNIAHSHAKKSGEPVLFFSLEMPARDIIERGLQMELGMSGFEIENRFANSKNAPPDIASKLHEIIPNLYVIDKSGLDLNDIKQYIKLAEDRKYHKQTGLVVIDYLGLIRSRGNGAYEQISNVARGLKELAKELDVPIIFLTQVNKLKSEHEKLDINSARDSGVIAEASDFVLSMWQDKDVPEKVGEKNLIIAFNKNRKGNVGEIPFAMSEKSLRFRER